MKAAIWVLTATVLFSACKSKHPSSLNPGKKSTATNADFATKDGKKSKRGKKGAALADAGQPEGFVVMPYKSQVVGPNLVFIEGGRFTMGALEEDVMNSRDNRERTVSVQSFYMDETEISNLNYLEYLHYIQRDSSAEVAAKALPDTTVWYDPLSFNDSYVSYYFRHPGFRLYPVVGVSWVQANDYSIWRTNFVNANLAKQANGKGKKGVLGKKSKKKGQALAESEALMASANARPSVESGYVLPDYRLPTEAEWEYACRANMQTAYSWGDDPQKASDFAWFYDNSAGSYQKVGLKKPNPWGLYDMHGNVSEWCLDFHSTNYVDFRARPGDGYHEFAPDDVDRTVRGGSFELPLVHTRLTNRARMNPTQATADVGVRPVRKVDR